MNARRTKVKIFSAGLLVLAGHVLLAPMTVRALNSASKSIKAWADARQHADYLAAAQATKVQVRPDLLYAVESLRDWLAKTDRRLAIILVPTQRSLMDDDGVPLRSPSPPAKAMAATEAALKARGIAVVNLLPDTYREALRDPSGLFRDRVHYTNEFELTVAGLLRGRIASEGVLYLGDCFARNLAAAAERAEPGLRVQSFWKNGTTQAMAYELSRCAPDEMAGVHDVCWVIGDFALGAKDDKFAPCSTEPVTPQAGEQVVYAKLVEQTPVKSTLNKESSYEDALVVNKFRKPDGEYFLGVIEIMIKRSMQEGARQWVLGESFKMTIVDWDYATRSQASLKNIQMIDDIQDYQLPRFRIVEWIHASN